MRHAKSHRLVNASLIFSLLTIGYFFPFVVSGQDMPAHRSRLKQLITSLNTAKDTTRVDILLKLSRNYSRQQWNSKANLDSALSCARNALDLSTRLKFKKGINEARFLQGEVYIKSLRQHELNELLAQCDQTTWALITIEGVKFETLTNGLNMTFFDSLLAQAKKALAIGEKTNNIRLCAMAELQLSNLYYSVNDIKNGRAFLRKSFATSRKVGYIEGEAEIFSQSNFLYDDKSIYDEIVTTGDSIVRVYDEIPDQDTKARVEDLLLLGYDQIAYFHISRGRLEQALSITLRIATMLEKKGNPELSEGPYLTIGKVYLDMRNFEKCIEYVRVARAIAWKKNGELQGNALRNAIRAYAALNQPKEGLKFLSETVAHGGYEHPKSKYLVAESYGTCYLAMKQYDQAEKYYLEAYAIMKRGNYGKDILALHPPMARLYVQTREYTKAEGYLKDLVSKENLPIVPRMVQRDAYYMLFRIDSVLGRRDNAMHHLYAYQALNDSLFNERKNSQLEDLRFRYETDKKDQDLKLLKNQTELQEADLRNATLYRNGLIIGAGILFVILTMVYSRFRLKQRTARLLEEKQEKISQSNFELQQLNGQLQKLLGEKEWLVKEIHHRVKNNLQIVISLLRTQAEHLRDGDALDAINESQLRMQVISLLHQKLYKVDTESNIDMKAYVPDLVNCIRESSNEGTQIYFDVRVDDIPLDISQAVPAGLILNEAITNAIKYAYPKGQRGTIHVYLLDQGDRRLLLGVADEGKGLPAEFDTNNLYSVGMKLMETLAAQLEGTFELKSNGGTTLEVGFDVHAGSQRSELFAAHHSV